MANHQHPNIVVCLCDQLRAFEVGCYGNSVVRTPSIDRLARNGVQFQTACSNNPVCTPGRSILISGQYSRTCVGTLTNCDHPRAPRSKFPVPTLADALKPAGYHTGAVGKWHIALKPETLGFDYALYPHYSHRYTGQTFYGTDEPERVIEGFSYEYEIEALNRYVRDHREEPFFLFYNISQPHMPHDDAPERYKTMYSRDVVPLRSNVWQDGKLSYNENWFRIYLWDFLYYQHHLPYTDKPLDGFDLRDLTALYYGLTTWTDDQVGELMRALEANGLVDDTIVVFTSDHGDNLGSHHFFNKERLYEESIRIPLIFHWPEGLRPRREDRQIASLVDVAPTLLSAAGLGIPDGMQGLDLSPVMKGEADTVGENVAFIETVRGEIGIRTQTHLYGIQKERDGHARTLGITDPDYAFFDVVNDPYEFHNLAKTGRDKPIADELRERLIRWDAETPWLEV